jgi:hypothetical protein
MKKYLVPIIAAVAIGAGLLAGPAIIGAVSPGASATPQDSNPSDLYSDAPAYCPVWNAADYCPAYSLYDSGALERVAAVLGLSYDQLTAQINDGKSIAEVAAAQNVSLGTVVEAVIAPQVDFVNSQVQSGALTQEQADSVLTLLRSRVEAALQTSPADGFICPVWGDEGNGTVQPFCGGPGYGYAYADPDAGTTPYCGGYGDNLAFSTDGTTVIAPYCSGAGYGYSAAVGTAATVSAPSFAGRGCGGRR